MNSTEAIKIRTSCRNFKPILLNPDDKKNLENTIINSTKLFPDEKIELSIIEKTNSTKVLKLNYGMIKGHNTYLLGKTKNDCNSRVHYGYLMEKIVIKATEMGVSSCWIGIFDDTFFDEIEIEDGYEIAGIVILGYPAEKQSMINKFSRFVVKASKRADWEKLFFNYTTNQALTREEAKDYSESLEMLRLSPSAGNHQPWRVFFDTNANEFHFFKKIINKNYEAKGLHDIDLGIGLCHFELASSQNNLTGQWVKLAEDKMKTMDDLHYVMTWKIQ